MSCSCRYDSLTSALRRLALLVTLYLSGCAGGGLCWFGSLGAGQSCVDWMPLGRSVLGQHVAVSTVFSGKLSTATGPPLSVCGVCRCGGKGGGRGNRFVTVFTHVNNLLKVNSLLTSIRSHELAPTPTYRTLSDMAVTTWDHHPD